MGVTLPLTAEGQKREKNNGGNKEIEEGGNECGGKLWKRKEKERYRRQAYKRVGREQGNQKGD